MKKKLLRLIAIIVTVIVLSGSASYAVSVYKTQGTKLTVLQNQVNQLQNSNNELSQGYITLASELQSVRDDLNQNTSDYITSLDKLIAANAELRKKYNDSVEQIDKLKKELAEPKQDFVYNLFTRDIPRAEYPRYSYLSEYIVRLPKPVKDVLNKENCGVEFINNFEDIKNGKYKNYAGLFSNVEGYKIYINNKHTEDREFRANTLLHEIGHAYDNYKQLSSSKDFQVIYKEEVDKLFNSNRFPSVEGYRYYTYYHDSAEYFAECFSYYFLWDENTEVMKSSAPKTYDFIKKCVGEQK